MRIKKVVTPWASRYYGIIYRCNNPKSSGFKYYGKKGIKCLITSEEIKILWERDNASSMKKPSIDRIDNKGNYEFKNCRFIESQANLLKSQEKKDFTYSPYAEKTTQKGKILKAYGKEWVS
jgi:hypothetical protein